MATDKIQTAIRFKSEILDKMAFIAKKNHRSLNAQLEYLSELYINEYEKENGKIELYKIGE